MTNVQEDVATTDPLTTMAALFNRPDSDLKLIEQGTVPRGWLYDIGGGMYLRNYSVEDKLKVDGLPGGGGSAEGKATLTKELAKIGITR